MRKRKVSQKSSRPAGPLAAPTGTERTRRISEPRVGPVELEPPNVELLRARTEIERGLARYADLYDFAPVGYFTLTRDGTIREANLAAAAILGVERTRLVAGRLGCFFPAASRPRFNAFLRGAFRAGARAVCELPLPRDGNLPLQVRLEAAASEDRKECRVVMVDITERQRAEAALRASEARFALLFAKAPLAATLTQGPVGVIVEINEAFERTFGFSRREATGRTTLELGIISRETHDGLLAAYRAFGSLRSHETVVRTKSGEQRTVLVTAESVAIEGRPHVISTAHDITMRKRIETELEESRAQLRALLARLHQVHEEERVRMARAIHDELGQLLTGLKMDLGWLDKRLSAPASPRLLRARIRGASQVIDDTVSAVQRMAAELRPSTLDALGLEPTLREEARRFRRHSGIGCRVVTADPLPPLPPGQAVELFYICREALTNVARHAKAAQAVIRLAVRDRTLELEVADDGVGLKQAAGAGSRSLGLLGMRERARRCGASIFFAPNKPRGTRVRVLLPLSPERAGREGAPP